MEEEEKKQTITLDANGFIDKKMGKAEFWIRFVLWLGLAVIAPFAYICVSFGIFESKDTTTTLSGWGVIAVIFLCIMLLIVVNNVRKGLPYGNFFRLGRGHPRGTQKTRRAVRMGRAPHPDERRRRQPLFYR